MSSSHAKTTPGIDFTALEREVYTTGLLHPATVVALLQRLREAEAEGNFREQYEIQARANVVLRARVTRLEQALQDLYDWGCGADAPPQAHVSWDRAWGVLREGGR